MTTACAEQSAKEAPSRAAREKSVDRDNIASQNEFEALLHARNEEYESRRKALFANPQSVAYLQKRAVDTDPVTAFVARQLHLWATEKPKEITELEEFISVGMYANKERLEKTAVGFEPSREISAYLHRQGNKKIHYEHLLLKVLMRPKDTSNGEDSALQSFYFKNPVSEPEVWIRIALEDGDERLFDYLRDASLRVTDKRRTLRALDYERSRSSAKKTSFPPQLESLRLELAKSAKQ
jgi:hypothetical protein